MDSLINTLNIIMNIILTIFKFVYMHRIAKVMGKYIPLMLIIIIYTIRVVGMYKAQDLSFLILALHQLMFSA